MSDGAWQRQETGCASGCAIATSVWSGESNTVSRRPLGHVTSILATSSAVPSTFDGDGAALIFDAQYNPKPAYDALLEALDS